MPDNETKKRHLRVEQFHQPTGYKSKSRANSASVPIRGNFRTHGAQLGAQVATLQNDYATLAQSWEGNEAVKARGITVELESLVNAEIDTKRLESNGWQFLNERSITTNGQVVKLQAWFVPDGKLAALSSIITDYLTKTVTVNGGRIQPKYRPLVDAIERVGVAVASQLWTEPDEPFPSADTIWFEVWLRRGETENEREAVLTQFKALSESVGIVVGQGKITLPEHTIIAVKCSGDQLSQELALLACIAELRRGRDYADVFDGMRAEEQAEWASLLIGRLVPKDHDLPFVSVLDTGINRGHPLLENLIPEVDNDTIKAAWTSADDDNHGTMLAGLCLFGDLTPVLAGSGQVQLPINVEGVKIVPPPAIRGDDEKLAGAYTAQGIAIVEGRSPNRKRVFCITTAMEAVNRPIPSSWSSQMDASAYGLDNDGASKRLLCLSAGNVRQQHWKDYPAINHVQSVSNPGQSWNALCVGAFTDFQLIRQAGAYTPVASRGALSPVSSTSLAWESAWPNKPDVVFEGGNAGFQAANGSTLQLPEMMLLSTHAEYHDGAFATLMGTSPATALAARMAAQIVKEYPSLSQESVRGLVVHSARWTDRMLEEIPDDVRNNKLKRANFLLRTVGYGVPDLRRAVESIGSRATLIAECEIQPFKMDRNEIVFNQMHVHSLPWPISELGRHATENVTMRVTLSYFIEPNPGNRGYTSTFRYSNCGLRFKVSSPNQTLDDLKAEVSKVAADEFARDNRTIATGSTDGWTLGKTCFRGSVHSDIWEGSAADLLSMGHIVVFPVTGWWRTRPSHNRSAAKMKYSLIVTLEGQNPELDIYTEIENMVNIPVAIAT